MKRWGRQVRLRAVRHRSVLVALVGAAMLILGCGVHLAGLVRMYGSDELSHVGYALSIRDGNLPTIDTRVPGEGRSEEIEFALDRASTPRPLFSPHIYTANNPPLVYAAAVPFTTASLRLGLPGGPLFGFRLVNVLGAVAAIGCTYALSWELTRDRVVAALAAGFLATSNAVVIVSSLAAIDGPSLAATTLVMWALVRVVRRRTLTDATLLGVSCALASAVRPMALAVAVAAGAIGALALLRTHGLRSLPAVFLRLALPTVAFVSWFYVLSVVRYGDPTGSSYLFEKFAMSGEGRRLSDRLLGSDFLVGPLGYLLAERYGSTFFFMESKNARRLATFVVLGVPVAAAISTVRQARRRQRGERDVDGSPAGAAWVAVLVISLVPPLLLAQHWSGGGGAHPRYLLGLLPVVAVSVATILRRIHWSVALVALGTLAALQIHWTRGRGSEARDLIAATPRKPMDVQALPDPWPEVALVVAVVGAIVLLVGIVLAARADSASSGSGDVVGDPPGDSEVASGEASEDRTSISSGSGAGGPLAASRT